MTRTAASEAAADPVDEETSRGVYSIGAVSTMYIIGSIGIELLPRQPSTSERSSRANAGSAR